MSPTKQRNFSEEETAAAAGEAESTTNNDNLTAKVFFYQSFTSYSSKLLVALNERLHLITNKIKENIYFR